jgi:transcriptional regulator GlxA family with amidase domain
MFLIDLNKAPQSAYAIFATQRAHGDEEVLRAQGIIESEFARALTLDELARQVTMSRRNFVRRFKRATGNAPREYLGRVRVEAAKRALERTPRPIAAIAADVGYEDMVALRQLFARSAGLTPSEYRARHRAVL